jgi:hypothetical protein
MRVRFWIYWHGWTKVSMDPGDSFSLEHYAPNDEGGGNACTRTYSYVKDDGKGEAWIVQEDYSRGRDCDGYSENTTILKCRATHAALHANNLPDYDRVGPIGRHPFYLPFKGADWRPLKSFQRDHSAEAAGY